MAKDDARWYEFWDVCENAVTIKIYESFNYKSFILKDNLGRRTRQLDGRVCAQVISWME